MRSNTLRALMAIGASVTLVATATAGSWNATTDFSTTTNAGVWQYGTAAVANNNWLSTTFNVNSYAFAVDTYGVQSAGWPNYKGLGSYEADGYMWAASEHGNTEWENTPEGGAPKAWTALVTGALPNQTAWTMTKNGVWVSPYAIGDSVTGLATVLRFTAPEAGTFDVASSLYQGYHGNLVDQLIKTDAGGVRTVLHDVTPIVPMPALSTDSFSGSVTLAVGETLDLVVYQTPVYQREFGMIDLTVSSVPEPTSIAVLGLGTLLALRRRRA